MSPHDKDDPRMVAQYAGAARQKSRAIEAMKRREG